MPIDAEPVTEQTLREHRLLARVEQLDAATERLHDEIAVRDREIEQLEYLLTQATEYVDPFEHERMRVH